MNCLVCKYGTMSPSTDSYFLKLENKYIIVENVPCYKCKECGEVLFNAAVVEKIDELIKHILFEPKTKVYILDFATAA